LDINDMKRKILMDYGLKIFQNYGAKPPKLGEEPILLIAKMLIKLTADSFVQKDEKIK